jgi:hypothetical protein
MEQLSDGLITAILLKQRSCWSLVYAEAMLPLLKLIVFIKCQPSLIVNRLNGYLKGNQTMEIPKTRFQIGHKYRKRGKNCPVCTVTDIHTTFNSKGEVVKQRYVATHEFMGQTIVETDVVDATIAMGNQ